MECSLLLSMHVLILPRTQVHRFIDSRLLLERCGSAKSGNSSIFGNQSHHPPQSWLRSSRSCAGGETRPPQMHRLVDPLRSQQLLPQHPNFIVSLTSFRKLRRYLMRCGGPSLYSQSCAIRGRACSAHTRCSLNTFCASASSLAFPPLIRPVSTIGMRCMELAQKTVPTTVCVM